MTLLEGYIAKWKSYPEDEVKVRVARPSVLSPSRFLLNAYKLGHIEWETYKDIFRKEMKASPNAMRKLRKIAELSQEKDVRLICYEKNPPCHRFILIDMIKQIQEVSR